MKQRLFNSHYADEKLQPAGYPPVTGVIKPKQRNTGNFNINQLWQSVWKPFQFQTGVLMNVKAIGIEHHLDDYEKRKLGIFNLLNFFQFITGMIVPVIVLSANKDVTLASWFIACIPPMISLAVLIMNHYGKYETASVAYFLLYPFFTSIVYIDGMNLGAELFFIMYGILSVFFLQDIGRMLFSVSLSMISYFMLAVVLKKYHFQLEQANYFFYLFNQLLAIVFIFYGLFLIKKENTDYQYSILAKNEELHESYLAINEQRKEIAEKALLLEEQKEELTELNALKNRLFSVIAHDLKSPMYALRNLFRSMHQQDMPAEDIKSMVPDVVNDLNYTTSLMDNLLQWAKSQMSEDAIRPQQLDVAQVVNEVVQLLRLQAEVKKINIRNNLPAAMVIFADRDMVHLVLRNLLSNAIKFTKENGQVIIDANEKDGYAEIFVKDSGVGISGDALKQIRQNNYYTTKGTASESGTGLGLMLCKEFLIKNGGKMHIESDPGKGSTFSFTLPKQA